MKMKSNNEKEILTKIANNKLLLFLVPNLICWYPLFYYYNQNVELVLSVLFYEVIIGCFIFLGINTIIYFLLQKILKNNQKVFCIMCITSFFYYIVDITLITFIILLLIILIIVVDFKYLINFSLDVIVSIISFVVIILFSFACVTGVYNAGYITLKSKNYDYEIDFDVDKEKNTPNIYWIHCDGMMNTNDLEKYFGKSYEAVEVYFNNNDYYYNNDATFITGHNTMRSLVSLFNPYYYDSFYKNYLLDFKNKYLEKIDSTKFIVNYNELEEKRLNNEIFQALGEKGYETIAIGNYGPHTSFNTDYYYDYYHYLGVGSPKKEFRYFEKGNNSELRLKSHIRLVHSELLFSNTFLKSLVTNLNYLNYDIIDYSNVDLSKYNYTSNTNYWISKGIFKAIDNSYSSEKAQFTFVDYKLNHYPIIFDNMGNFLTSEQQWDLEYYFENYVYASNLLFEMLDYIKSIDKDAVIVVQADHGIHTFDPEFIMNELNINKKELYEIRNSVISAVYVPEKYQNGDEEVLSNPLNISRYLVNNFVGDNYEYIN